MEPNEVESHCDSVLIGVTESHNSTLAQLSEKYLEELEKLMGDANPIIRSRALEHFRNTLGMEANGAVRVNINNQQTALFGAQQPHSFEEAMDRIRDLHMR